MNFLKRFMDLFFGEPDLNTLAQEAQASSDELREAARRARSQSAALIRQVRSDRRQADRMFEVASEASRILRGVQERSDDRR